MAELQLCEVHVEVHGLWAGACRAISKRRLNVSSPLSEAKDGRMPTKTRASSSSAMQEDAVDKACACQDIGGHVVTIIPTSLDRWEVYCAEDVVPGSATDYDHAADND